MNIKRLLPLTLISCFAALPSCTKHYVIKADTIVLRIDGDSLISQEEPREYLLNMIIAAAKDAIGGARVQTESWPETAGTGYVPPPQTSEPPTETYPIAEDLSGLEPFFTKEEIGLLKNIVRAESYVIDPDPNAKGGNSAVFRDFPVAEGPIKLTARHVDRLRHTLLNEEYHYDDGTAKNCLFRPDFGVRAYVSDAVFVDVLVAFYCDEWQFTFGKKQYQRDSKEARESIRDLMKDIHNK